MSTGITRGLSGGLGLIVFLGGAFGFMYAIEKTKNSAAGVPVLLAFTFFMGLMLSRIIGMVLGFKNGSELVMTAMGGTAGVFFVMASLASVIKRDISGMGKWLFVGAMVVFVGAIVNVFVGSTVGSVGLDGEFLQFMVNTDKVAEPASLENLLERLNKQEFDLVAVGRALLVDPDWAVKVRDGRESDILPFSREALKQLV